ncbi:DUF2442 domain-containing protein [Syntrophomonas palmitatica]|uniref:DUF2442 domain-containing protein n=1 Tax=Syntrophomonas palmitatica TaxID=402877 RepID=UPI0006D04B82|nr:DUF2442 domain-containing protein [Syntrophomonas palmitatica]
MNNIQSVTPLESFRLLVAFNNGSSITVDLSAKLKTVRFAELSDIELFNDVRADKNGSETIVWGDGVLKIPLYELIDVVISGK